MDTTIRIAPSLLAADFANLERDVRMVTEAGADMLHLDVMDGVFVPNISFGPGVIAALRPHTSLFFDVHLMITEPLRYIETFASAGADGITFHYESCENQVEVLKKIRSLGLRAGISIKPSTPAFVLEPLLPYTDMILVMTVEPGFGGQKFMPETMESLKSVARMVHKHGYSVDIQVDGGISAENAHIPAANGANMFVAGSAVFKAPVPADAISAIREAADGVYLKNIICE